VMREESNNTMNTMMNTSMLTMNNVTFYFCSIVILEVIKVLSNIMITFYET
jgi:hypothetical protein